MAIFNNFKGNAITFNSLKCGRFNQMVVIARYSSGRNTRVFCGILIGLYASKAALIGGLNIEVIGQYLTNANTAAT